MVPPTRPVRAALSRSALSEFFMVCFLAWGVLADGIRGLVLRQGRVLFAPAGKFIRPVGVKLRAKGYNAQEENAQVEQLKSYCQFFPACFPRFRSNSGSVGEGLSAALPCLL